MVCFLQKKGLDFYQMKMQRWTGTGWKMDSPVPEYSHTKEFLESRSFFKVLFFGGFIK